MELITKGATTVYPYELACDGLPELLVVMVELDGFTIICTTEQYECYEFGLMVGMDEVMRISSDLKALDAIIGEEYTQPIEVEMFAAEFCPDENCWMPAETMTVQAGQHEQTVMFVRGLHKDMLARLEEQEAMDMDFDEDMFCRHTQDDEDIDSIVTRHPELVAAYHGHVDTDDYELSGDEYQDRLEALWDKQDKENEAAISIGVSVASLDYRHKFKPEAKLTHDQWLLTQDAYDTYEFLGEQLPNELIHDALYGAYNHRVQALHYSVMMTEQEWCNDIMKSSYSPEDLAMIKSQLTLISNANARMINQVIRVAGVLV
jgi:hypothetical protein